MLEIKTKQETLNRLLCSMNKDYIDWLHSDWIVSEVGQTISSNTELFREGENNPRNYSIYHWLQTSYSCQ